PESVMFSCRTGCTFLSCVLSATLPAPRRERRQNPISTLPMSQERSGAPEVKKGGVSIRQKSCFSPHIVCFLSFVHLEMHRMMRETHAKGAYCYEKDRIPANWCSTPALESGAVLLPSRRRGRR